MPYSIPFNGKTSYGDSFKDSFNEHKNSEKFQPYTTRLNRTIKSPISETSPVFYQTTSNRFFDNRINEKNNIVNKIK